MSRVQAAVRVLKDHLKPASLATQFGLPHLAERDAIESNLTFRRPLDLHDSSTDG
jgi:hypothetical protein